ncbi:MAG: hypothetical protein HY782_28780 [Chloroflexi bacterium]|nr:hypothetical protein [Chloroflexota bacterium]
MKRRKYFAIGIVAALWALAACARVPVPTADQPTFTPSPLATLASVVATPMPSAAIPTSTVLPTGTPTSVSVTAIPTRAIMPSSSPTPILTPIAFDRNPRAILVEADVTGGSNPAPRDMHVPLFRLYADGFVLLAGERAPLTTGLDAAARVGYLSETDIQSLLAYLRDGGFNSLNAYYEPRPAPKDAPTAQITVYLNKTKTVRVFAPDSPTTPKPFSDALARITQTVPSELTTFVPTDGYLIASAAGSTSDHRANSDLVEWGNNVGVRLADAMDGVTVSGSAFSNAAALIGRAWPKSLFREGNSVYRVRLASNLPRAVHLTDWIGTILEAPREFDRRAFDLVGYYRGANLFGEARGNPPTRGDWVLVDDSGAIYVSGIAPQGFDPSSRVDAWNVVRVRAVVVYVRSGTSYLEARSVDASSSHLSANPIIISNAQAAIAAVKSRFPEMGKIKPAGAGMIGASTDIKVVERADGWDLAFWEGWGDCPAGCINHRYSYFSVKKDGRLQKAGEYSRIYNATGNSFDTTGAPLWGVPK